MSPEAAKRSRGGWVICPTFSASVILPSSDRLSSVQASDAKGTPAFDGVGVSQCRTRGATACRDSCVAGMVSETAFGAAPECLGPGIHPKGTNIVENRIPTNRARCISAPGISFFCPCRESDKKRQVSAIGRLNLVPRKTASDFASSGLQSRLLPLVQLDAESTRSTPAPGGSPGNSTHAFFMHG